ncbi:hypothetical protein JD793_004937 [Citrobacter braakii]|nr:hypothetical protein [Citrobacter braakii]
MLTILLPLSGLTPVTEMLHVPAYLAGEKCFIDYCGSTESIISLESGEYGQTRIFVAVPGASNYTFAEATYTQLWPD